MTHPTCKDCLRSKTYNRTTGERSCHGLPPIAGEFNLQFKRPIVEADDPACSLFANGIAVIATLESTEEIPKILDESLDQSNSDVIKSETQEATALETKADSTETAGAKTPKRPATPTPPKPAIPKAPKGKSK